MKPSKYRLTCIKLKSGKFWWYYVERGVSNPTKRATGVSGKRNRAEAEARLKALEEREQLTDKTFREYAGPYFTNPDTCPHLMKLRGEGRELGEKYVKKSRQLLETVIFKDHRISDMKIAEIKRRDIIEFRTRLMTKLRHGDGRPKYRTIQQVMETLTVVFREAYFREDIDRDPTVRIGKIRYEQAKRGVFTLEELKALFPREGLGPWKNWTAHVMFLLAYQAGMRQAEIRALIWDQIDEQRKRIHVNRAFKGSSTKIGLPKRDKVRVTFLTNRTLKAMDKLKAETFLELSKRKRPASEFVFVNPATGKPFSDPWWQDRFQEALEAIGIGREQRLQRVLVPHSLRHTCNTILRNQGADDFKRKDALWGLTKSEIEDRYTNVDAIDLEPLSRIMEKQP
jgi:integrase